jgi:hypothetical protein
VNAWVAIHFSAELERKIMGLPALQPQTVEDHTIDPRPIVQGC